MDNKLIDRIFDLMGSRKDLEINLKVDFDDIVDGKELVITVRKYTEDDGYEQVKFISFIKLYSSYLDADDYIIIEIKNMIEDLDKMTEENKWEK